MVVYGLNQSGHQADLWSEILRVRSWRSGPWIIGGDFNIVRFSDERKGRDLNNRDRGKFNELISNLGLIKIPMTEHRYTWSSMRVELSMAKLDRVFVFPEWKTKFSLATMHPMRRPTSDHVPIKLDSGKVKKRKNESSGLKGGGWSIRRCTNLLDKAGGNEQTRKTQQITSVRNSEDCTKPS